MKPFLAIFLNELRAVLRSKTLFMLLAASVAWMLAAPYVFTGDGTESGLRELTLHYSLGGVAALVAVSLLVAATGSIAGERAAKRLALTMVRPVGYFTIALGKTAALTLTGAFVLAVAAAILFAERTLAGDGGTVCRHVLRPVMPPVRQEAEAMYADYMANTNTPEAVRKAKKEVVLRLLANRAADRYDTIPTNVTWRWKINLQPPTSDLQPSTFNLQPSVRLKFSTMFDQRDDVAGTLRFGEFTGVVSNITQAVVEIPLKGNAGNGGTRLEFTNAGKNPVMLRPRRDVELLVPADGFGANLLRTWCELVALMAILVAFGVFLGTALGRPSALFTAVVTLLLSEMAPGVIDQYADELESDRVDAVGLAITRAAAYVTRPVSSITPLASLSRDECVEPRETLRILFADLALLPVLFALLSALIMPRKP